MVICALRVYPECTCCRLLHELLEMYQTSKVTNTCLGPSTSRTPNFCSFFKLWHIPKYWCSQLVIGQNHTEQQQKILSSCCDTWSACRIAVFNSLNVLFNPENVDMSKYKFGGLKNAGRNNKLKSSKLQPTPSPWSVCNSENIYGVKVTFCVASLNILTLLYNKWADCEEVYSKPLRCDWFHILISHFCIFFTLKCFRSSKKKY